MPNRLYETVLTISVLGNEPYAGGLDELSEAVMTGDFSGHIRSEEVRDVEDPDEQQRLADEHGSDIGFFMLDEDSE